MLVVRALYQDSEGGAHHNGHCSSWLHGVQQAIASSSGMSGHWGYRQGSRFWVDYGTWTPERNDRVLRIRSVKPKP